MKQHQRDAITHLGFAASIFGLWNIGTFTGASYWIIMGAIWVLLIAGLLDLFFPDFLGSD